MCEGETQSLQKTAAVYETVEVFSGCIFRGTGAVFRSFGFVLTIRTTAPIYKNPLVLATFSKVSVSSVQKNQGGKFGRISLLQFSC